MIIEDFNPKPGSGFRIETATLTRIASLNCGLKRHVFVHPAEQHGIPHQKKNLGKKRCMLDKCPSFDLVSLLCNRGYGLLSLKSIQEARNKT